MKHGEGYRTINAFLAIVPWLAATLTLLTFTHPVRSDLASPGEKSMTHSKTPEFTVVPTHLKTATFSLG